MAKQPDERSGLLCCALQRDNQAAQSMLAWSWGREAFGRGRVRADRKTAKTAREERRTYCCEAGDATIDAILNG